MCFFRKRRTEREQLLINKHDIEDMTAQVEVLLSLSRDNVELADILAEIKEKIKYFNPTMNKDALDFDKKISNKIGDMKIEINKAKSTGDYTKPIESARDLRDSLIAERTARAVRRK